jgi:hypothetical protein
MGQVGAGLAFPATQSVFSFTETTPPSPDLALKNRKKLQLSAEPNSFG